jgi:Mg2+ and Co2+ transporter CorA
VNSEDIVERRITRHDTVRRYHDSREDLHSPTQPAWEEPGAEPGIDTSKEPESRFSHMLQECQITVVDVAEDNVSKYDLDNEGLKEFLKKPREDWVQTRWINVNGFSYDVISLLQSQYGLHGLAVEDMLSIHGRTKIDWYPDHAFSKSIILVSLLHIFMLLAYLIFANGHFDYPKPLANPPLSSILPFTKTHPSQERYDR